jgi:pyridoxine 4-dehydrogenase
MDVHHTSNKLARRVCAGFGWSGSICISCTRSIPSVPFDEQIGALRKLRDDGKIRFVGLSNVNLEQLQRAQRIVEITAVQNNYNVGNRTSEAELEHCEANGIAFIAYFPLDGGDLHTVEALRPIARAHGASVWQIGLAWLLHRSAALLPIPGTSSLEHLAENMASACLSLSPEEFRLLDDLDAAQTR